jgi:hypothetical protein
MKIMDMPVSCWSSLRRLRSYGYELVYGVDPV